MKSALEVTDNDLFRRPRKGAWIEIPGGPGPHRGPGRRPRKGAWIEMMLRFGIPSSSDVAPARGRGLKYAKAKKAYDELGRPRKGAWIEIG